MRILILIMTIILQLLNFDANASNFEKGILDYNKGQFSSAAEAFEAEIKTNSSNISSFFNLGLTYYKLNKNGLALWAFEKAHKLKPNDVQIQEMRSRISKELGLDTPVKESKIDAILYAASSTMWSIISIVLFTIMMGLIVYYSFSYNSFQKRVLLSSASILFVLGILFMYAANKSFEFHQSSNKGIIINTISSDSEFNKTGIQIKEGTTGEIIGNKDSLMTLQTLEGKKITIHASQVRTY